MYLYIDITDPVSWKVSRRCGSLDGINTSVVSEDYKKAGSDARGSLEVCWSMIERFEWGCGVL